MPSIREQIAAKRAEVRNSPARKNAPATPRGVGAPSFAPGFGPADERLDDKTVSGQIAKAARSGRLDIALLELDAVPPAVYMDLLGIPEDELSRPPAKAAPTAGTPRPPGLPRIDALSLADAPHDDEEAKARVFSTPPPKKPWTEPEELTAFKAGGNRIKEIEVELGLFGGLKTLDLHGNQLTSIPDAIADLLQLEWIDLSQNALTSLPPALLLIPRLETINLANNAVSVIDLTSPVKPSEEGLSYGTGFLISAFERAERAPKTVLPVLRSLNLANNALTVPALRGFAGRETFKLRIVNLANNKLEGKLDVDATGFSAHRLPELASLVLEGNSRLEDVVGDVAEGCAINTDGCGARMVASGIGGVSPGGSPAKSARPAATSTAGDKYQPQAGDGPTDVPEPSTTVTFVTHPAATFDSEPLAVEMDVYVPPDASADKPLPVIIWWHGGGLLQGNKENLPPHLRRLPRRPLGPKGEHVIVISPNYRLSPQAPILDVLADVDAAVNYTRTKLNDKLAASGIAARVDPDRIILSGGSAGGYLALMAGMPVPDRAADADIGGYRGASGLGFKPVAIAPFYPITDLEHVFWATETNPVPWWPDGSVPDAAARPHLNTRDPPVATAVSGGPRSILYPYMLQHGLFPSLLFLNQRSRGHGLEGYRPSPHTMSVTTRCRLLTEAGVSRPPIYLAYGTIDDKIQPLDESIELLRATDGPMEVEVIPGADHAYDEDPAEQAETFVKWLESLL